MGLASTGPKLRLKRLEDQRTGMCYPPRKWLLGVQVQEVHEPNLPGHGGQGQLFEERIAMQGGDLPPNFPVKIRYSTAAGEWMECSARPVLWITSDHSDSALRRFHLSCFGVAPLAESPWWHH